MINIDRYETAKAIGDNKRVQEFGDDMVEAVYTLREMQNIHEASIYIDGNESDAYMRGLYNGMEYARSIFEKDTPIYKEATYGEATCN